MKYNYKKMDKLSAKLERLFQPTNPRGVIWTEPLEQHNPIAPGERIVEDYFDDADGETVIITERITADASDEGYDFPDGTWDRKRLDAINRNPPPIHIEIWKKRRSSRIAPIS